MEDFFDPDEFEFEEYGDNIPRIQIDSATSVQDVELMLASRHDEFYRRMVDHVMHKLEGVMNVKPVAILVDEDGTEYEMEIQEDGFNKSLEKATEYFIGIEEYETCDLIRQMVEIINKKNEL